jgi:hypothetical protein
MDNSLPYSYFHRLSTEVNTNGLQTSAKLCFSEAVANCAVLRVVRRHVSEQREQRASNFQNISNVSLIFINSKCIDLLGAGSKGKFLYFYIENWILYHSFRSSSGRDKSKHNKCRLYGPPYPETKPIHYQRLF